MFVIAQHSIQDPQAFWSTVASAELPAGITVSRVYASPDGRTGVCLWNAPSLGEVARLVDAAVGHISTNEYFEVHAGTSVGLPA